MSDQTIFLILLVSGLVITLYLYIFKAKKEVIYKKDERWRSIEQAAIIKANYTNYVLLFILAIAGSIPLFTDFDITLSLNRVCTYGLLFIALRNGVELFSLLHYDKSM